MIKTELKIILATDNAVKLAEVYEAKKKTLAGKTILDVSSVWEKLISWTIIEKADLAIPFNYGKQTKEPIGSRIWLLSQPHESNYYNGQFFDIKISNTKKRTIRKECKISPHAIEFFKTIEVNNE